MHTFLSQNLCSIPCGIFTIYKPINQLLQTEWYFQTINPDDYVLAHLSTKSWMFAIVIALCPSSVNIISLNIFS